MVKRFQYGRRSFIAAMVANLLVLAGCNDQAEAILFSGVGSGGGGSGLITTLSMRNASGSSETPMWSKVFGLGFPDSDTTGCPLSGGNPTYPVFKIGSTTYSYSMSVAPTYYPSGRLMHATFCILYGTGVTIANSTSASVDVYQSNNTSLPSASSRALSDFSTADLKHLVTGLDNVSGNYSATLNDGIADAFSDNYVWLDGPAGKMWRIRARYKQAGTAEGNLEAYVYCMAMQNNSGGFGGIRFNWCKATPFGDAALAKRDWKSFSAMTLQTGATVIRDNVTSGRSNSANFTWSSGGNMNATANVFEAGTLCRLTTTGTLPTGLSTSVSYWINQATQTYTPPYNVFSLDPGPLYGGPTIPSGSGSGTHTATVYPWISCYSRLFMCGTNAEWDFVQGGGSFTPVSTYIDTNIQTVFSPAYWRSTKLVPSYDLTPTVTPGTAQSFYVNTLCGISNFQDTGGPSDWIGMLPGAFARHFYTQSQIDETNVRGIGLTAGQQIGTCRNLGNGGTLPAYNNGTGGAGTPYSGMGALLPSSMYLTNVYVGNSANSTRSITGSSSGDYSHAPSYTYYNYLITGLPEYLDMQLELTTNGTGQQYQPGTVTADISTSHFGRTGLNTSGQYGSRNVTLDGITYYNAFMGNSQMRQGSWNLREVVYAASICPQNHPECAAYRTYFNDLRTTNIDYLEAIAQKLWGFNSYAQTNGLFFRQGGTFQAPWQNGMLQDVLSQDYGVTGYSKSLTLMNAYNKWVAHLVNTYGVSAVNWFEVLVASSSSLGQGPMITSDLGLGFVMQGTLTWANGSANFTVDVSSGYVPAVNDIVHFQDEDLASTAPFQPVPAAFTAYVPYYVKTVSGSGGTRTMTLSATQGGSAISNTDSSAQLMSFWLLNSTPGTSIIGTNDSTSTATQVARPCLYSVSRGATLDAAAEALIMGAGGIAAATTGNFAAIPQWCFGKVA